jgi:hypothetical protein
VRELRVRIIAKGLQLRRAGEAASMMAQAFPRHKHLRKSNPLGRIDCAAIQSAISRVRCSWGGLGKSAVKLRITTPVTWFR